MAFVVFVPLLPPVFSTSKGISALVVAWCVERGLLLLRAPGGSLGEAACVKLPRTQRPLFRFGQEERQKSTLRSKPRA